MKLEEIKNKTNEAVSYLVAALESGQSDVLTQYLNAMARFHNYSFGNIMLIARQKPQATNVAGIRTWNSLGRFVKRGEKGILILAPMIGRKKTDGAADSTADAKEATAQLYGFRAVYVFDVTQTEGKDFPALTEVQGDVSGYRERLVKFVESQNVTLNYSERIAPAKGLSFGGKITLLSGMQPAEEFSTLVHEIAHEMLHRGERRTLTTKQMRETEAEAVAFVVCQSVGLQTGTAATDYIQLWHGDAKLLQESLEVVQRTAAVILGGIAPEDDVAQPNGTWPVAMAHRTDPAGYISVRASIVSPRLLRRHIELMSLPPLQRVAPPSAWRCPRSPHRGLSLVQSRELSSIRRTLFASCPVSDCDGFRVLVRAHHASLGRAV